MRLRVTVRRNGIPDFPLVWAVDTTSSPTVYQLLEQINEVAPVTDNDQWGLEDYAVEIKGSNGANYECLHYQLVQSVMKDEDEIIIRPLLLQDRKARVVSGRHQISADGRHIYDGIPLGRPKLKRIRDRPPVKIQALKRQRLLDDDKADDEEQPHPGKNQQLILHGDFDDEDSEDDEDFAPEEDEDSDEEESEEGAESEKDISIETKEKERLAAESDEEDIEKAGTIEPILADVTDPAFRATIRKLHSAFPTSSLRVCKFILQGTEGDMDEAYEALNRGFVPSQPKSAITEMSKEQDSLSTSIHSEAIENPEFQDSMQVEADMTADSLLEYYDQNGLPPGSIKSGKALKFMADAMRSSPVSAPPPQTESKAPTSARLKRKALGLDKGLSYGLTSTPAMDMESQDVEASSDDTSDSSSSEEEGDDDESDKDGEKGRDEDSSGTSSDDSSDDESSSDSSSSEEEARQEVDSEMDESSSTSDSETSSDSSSDDEAPEESSSRLDTSASVMECLDVSIIPLKKSVKNQEERPYPGPGKGKPATHSRNRRRQHANILRRYKNKGILPAGTTINEFVKIQINEKTSPEDALAKLEQVRQAKSSTESDYSNDFERRRKELLDSLASGGVEVGTQPNITTSRSPSVPIQPLHLEKSCAAAQVEDAVPDSQALAITFPSASETAENMQQVAVEQAMTTENTTQRPSMVLEVSQSDTPSTSPLPQPASAESSQKDGTRPRRSRLDMGAGKRLLFGALGIKTPKTRADEEKIKNDFMKLARPLKKTKPAEDQSVSKQVVEEDPEAWREKINYRAVECVQEGIELSEPPFPFVQRWDPQQQSSWPPKNNRGGKRKQEQRSQEHYYDDTRASKKQKRRKGKHFYAEEQEYLDASYKPSYREDTMELQYDDSQLENSIANDINDEVSQQLMRDIQAPIVAASQVPEDLASLPQDPSSLPNLQGGQAKVGMTIAFKSLECSAATNWAPQVSAYKTAIVIAFGQGDHLELSLAMRDRQQPQKRYDSTTGERVYAKFEVPDDEEMEDNDDGLLNLAFGEMIEPKIVQQPPINLSAADESRSNDVVGDTQHKPIGDEGPQPKDGNNPEGSKTMSHEEEPAEAQLCRVTDTPVHSDAPGEQPDSMIEDVPEKSSTSELQPDFAEEVLDESPRNDLSEYQNEMLRLVTPTREISDENRENINTLMKEAGFRSSVPSSLLKDIRPNSIQSPSDTTDFEKLKKDMSTPANVEKPYSPKFDGLGSSSPVRKQRYNSKSPSKPQEALASSSPQGTQKTWLTISEHDTPSPKMEQEQFIVEESSTWITDDQSAYPSSPPANQTVESIVEEQISPGSLGQEPASFNNEAILLAKEKIEEFSAAQMSDAESNGTKSSSMTKRKVKNKKTRPSKAFDLWQQFEPVEMKPSPESVESRKESPALGLGLDGINDEQSDPSVQYPKLSVGSSFTSQVTDAGRQPEPDSIFDESTILGGDVSEMEIDAPSLDTGELGKQQKDTDSAKPEAADTPDTNDSLIDVQSDSASRKPVNCTTGAPKTVPDISEDEPASDDSFPSLEALSQQRTIKREKVTSPISKDISKKEAGKKKAKSILIEDESHSSNQSAATAIQQKRQVSKARSSKSKVSEKAPAERSGAIPHASQPPTSTQQSVIIDLCDSSKPEAGEESDELKPSRFKNYAEYSDDDEDYQGEDSVGWSTKKRNTVGGVETKQYPGIGLKSSSEKALNRRKTVAR